VEKGGGQVTPQLQVLTAADRAEMLPNFYKACRRNLIARIRLPL